MNLQTFKAPTMAQALAQVKVEMGPHAVILHTRTYHRRYCLGLRRQEAGEITAGRGLGMGGAPRRQPPQNGGGGVAVLAPPKPSGSPQAAAYAAHASAGGPQPGRTLLETPAAGNAIMLG